MDVFIDQSSVVVPLHFYNASGAPTNPSSGPTISYVHKNEEAQSLTGFLISQADDIAEDPITGLYFLTVPLFSLSLVPGDVITITGTATVDSVVYPIEEKIYIQAAQDPSNQSTIAFKDLDGDNTRSLVADILSLDGTYLAQGIPLTNSQNGFYFGDMPNNAIVGEGYFVIIKEGGSAISAEEGYWNGTTLLSEESYRFSRITDFSASLPQVTVSVANKITFIDTTNATDRSLVAGVYTAEGSLVQNSISLSHSQNGFYFGDAPTNLTVGVLYCIKITENGSPITNSLGVWTGNSFISDESYRISLLTSGFTVDYQKLIHEIRRNSDDLYNRKHDI